MIKTILFDFDGVILDSMKIKGDGFVELFKSYDKSLVKKLEEFHYQNGGVSRFEKIRYFFRELQKEPVSDAEVFELADRFGTIIAGKLFDKNNLIAETVAFIETHYQRIALHVVSGAEEKELRNLCDFFELTPFFVTIEGSPTPKTELVHNILKRYGYHTEETVLVGDSINDRDAALQNGIMFLGYNNHELKGTNYLEKMTDLVHIL